MAIVGVKLDKSQIKKLSEGMTLRIRVLEDAHELELSYAASFVLEYVADSRKKAADDFARVGKKDFGGGFGDMFSDFFHTR